MRLIDADRLEEISIHAPHTGSDQPLPEAPLTEVISIHAPHTGSDADAVHGGA